MKAQEKVDKLNQALELGYEVYIRSYTQVIKVTKRDLVRFRKAGYELFKTDGKSLFVARGKKWDCIDFCGIEVR